MTASGIRGRRAVPGCLLALTSLPMVYAQSTQPAAEELPAAPAVERDVYNPWTSKQLTGDWGGLRTDLEEIGGKVELSYQQQFQQNMRGGLQTHNGHRLSGSYDLVLKLDFEKMDLIPDAGFYFKAKGNYSDGINPDKVGASSAATPNTDAFDDYPIYVKKWWYWHKFLDEKVEVRLGVLETNKDLYDVSLYANHEDKDFINKLSIRNATVPQKTGLGAHVKIEPVDWLYFQAATIDAQAEERHTRFDTSFHDEAWYLGFWEMGLTPEWASAKGPMPGRYRAGFWYDPHSREIFEDTLGGRRRTSYRGDNMGLYVGADQMLWKENDNPKDSQGLGLFTRYGHAHRNVSRISDYWQAGVSWKGLVPTRNEDVVAFSVAQAVYSELYRNHRKSRVDRETVYEWYYKWWLTPWCAISPDFQVITNPGGDKDARDAIVAGLRIRIIF